MGNGITVDIASSAILAGDPGAVSRGRKLNMEVEISFYQFMNAMATCAFHYCDIGETSGQAAAASPDVQLQTTAIERYIHLFQNRTVQPVSSNFSLDAPSSSPSRLSMTPSQTGVSHTSLTGASVAAKHAGSSVVVDSPMPVSILIECTRLLCVSSLGFSVLTRDSKIILNGGYCILLRNASAWRAL